MAPRNTSTLPRPAFTLIEMMVVVALIAILVGGVGYSLAGGGTSASLATAQRSIASVFQAARAAAILNGGVEQPDGTTVPFKSVRVRVLISDDDSEDSEIRWRYVGVVYGEADPTGQFYGQWFALNQGATLPQGIYVIAPSATSDILPESALRSDRVPTMRVEYPRQGGKREGGGTRWFYYEYDGSGVASRDANGKRIILAPGTLDPATRGITFKAAGATSASIPMVGLQLRRLGGVTTFEDVEEVR